MAIDIVFTDINLTGAASGWDVSECLLADRPNVPVLYTPGQVIERDRCVPGGVFIAKPYLMRISSTLVSNSEPNDRCGSSAPFPTPQGRCARRGSACRLRN